VPILSAGYDKNDPISFDGGVMRATLGLVFVLATLSVTGCGAGSAAPAVSTVTTPDGSTASAQAATTPTPSIATVPATGPTGSPAAGPSLVQQPADELVGYGRQGGLAGVDDRVVVRKDGAFTITRRGAAPVQGRLTQSELANLTGLLAASNFASLPGENKSTTKISDGYTYRVVYQGRQVTAEDGGVPIALEQTIGALNVLLSRG
jgi:hypothetical protein